MIIVHVILVLNHILTLWNIGICYKVSYYYDYCFLQQDENHYMWKSIFLYYIGNCSVYYLHKWIFCYYTLFLHWFGISDYMFSVYDCFK